MADFDDVIGENIKNDNPSGIQFLIIYAAC